MNQGEHTMPTHHPKIKIAKVITYPYEAVSADIDELLAINKKQDDEALVNKMKEIVPEFISRNSQFEYLDTSSGNEEYMEILVN